MGMKRKPRRVKEQGSFLKRQLKGSERSGAFKQPWEGGGLFLAGVQAAVPSGHSFLLNAAAPGPLLLLFQAAVESFPTPASEPGELCSVSSLAARLPPAPARALITELPAQRAPNPRTLHPRDAGASSPSSACHGQKLPPASVETPVCHHTPAQGGRLPHGIGLCSAGGRARCSRTGTWPHKMGGGNPVPPPQGLGGGG